MPVANPVLLIGGIMLASILPILDTTIANVAIPHMQSTLGAGPQSIMWVLTSYIICNAVAMPITGWLSDQIGRHRLFAGSVFAFIITSMLCGAAQNLEQMVIFRALQGVSGAFVMPISQSMILDTTKPSSHPQMMAIWGLGTILGPVMGPILGGWLTENWNWRWVFFVNAPLGLLALILLLPNMPRYPTRKRGFDMLGFGLLSVCLASLQLLLDRGQHVDWFDSLESWIYLGVCLATLWMTIIHLTTIEHPLFDRKLFRDMNFVIALSFMSACAMVIYTTMGLLPPMLQNLFGYDVVDTGMVIAPRGVGAILGMQIANFCTSRRLDPRYSIAGGFVVTIYTLWLMSGWSLDLDQFTLVYTGFLQGIGIGLVSLQIFVIAFATLDPHLRTDASGLLNLARLIASSVGISVVTALFARNIQVSHSDLAAHIGTSTSDVVDMASVGAFPEVGGSAMSLIDMEINRQAAMVAYVDDFAAVMWVTLAALPFVLLIRQRKGGAGPVSMGDAAGH